MPVRGPLRGRTSQASRLRRGSLRSQNSLARSARTHPNPRSLRSPYNRVKPILRKPTTQLPFCIDDLSSYQMRTRKHFSGRCLPGGLSPTAPWVSTLSTATYERAPVNTG